MKPSQSLIVSPGNPFKPFVIQRSPRRTLVISVNERGDVKVSAPFRLSQREIEAFIKKKMFWIRTKVEHAQKTYQTSQQKKFEHNHEFFFLGEKYKLHVAEKEIKRVNVGFQQSQWNVDVPVSMPLEEREKEIKSKLVQWYRREAQEILGSRLFQHSRQMGVEPKEVVIRTQKRMWGNCHYRKQLIHLNWQVIFLPLRVIDYVIIHELCHLNVPNHSKRFWKQVEKFWPHFREDRKWLRDHSFDLILPT